MNKTSIEWTHRPETGGAAGGFTWNPIRARLDICPGIKRSNGTDIQCGHRHDLAHRVCQAEGCLCDRKQTGTFCTRISPGCKLCYASAINIRFGNGLEYVVTNLANIEFFIDERMIQEPWKRKKPATIFVADMFDLFHEAIPTKLIVRVLEVCGWNKGHTFQILTKRAQRMCELVQELKQFGGNPPPWIWFGVSVEDQQRADERIPFLLQTPAAVRFLSVEPLLEAVDMTRLATREEGRKLDALRGIYWKPGSGGYQTNTCTEALIDWVICGGESGPGARMFRREWAESLLSQCRAAGVPFFIKQMGSYAVLDYRYDQTLPGATRRLRDRKGGDPEEWPEHLRVREFPPLKGDRVIYLRDEAKVGV